MARRPCGEAPLRPDAGRTTATAACPRGRGRWVHAALRAGPLLFAHALGAQLLEGPIGLGQALEAHAPKHPGLLRELDVAVLDHLHVVTPRIAEVEASARQDLGARLL